MADEKPILRFEHAYTPNEQASYGGGDHLVLDRDFERGRLRRKKDDALCKPQSKFWGLQETSPPHRICKRCLKLARRHGLDVPPTAPELQGAAGELVESLDQVQREALWESGDSDWLRIFDGDHERMHRAHGRLRAARKLRDLELLDDSLRPTDVGDRSRRLMGRPDSLGSAPEPPRIPERSPEERAADRAALESLFKS